MSLTETIKRLRSIADTRQASFVLVPIGDLRKLLEAYEAQKQALKSRKKTSK